MDRSRGMSYSSGNGEQGNHVYYEHLVDQFGYRHPDYNSEDLLSGHSVVPHGQYQESSSSGGLSAAVDLQMYSHQSSYNSGSHSGGSVGYTPSASQSTAPPSAGAAQYPTYSSEESIALYTSYHDIQHAGNHLVDSHHTYASAGQGSEMNFLDYQSGPHLNNELLHPQAEHISYSHGGSTDSSADTIRPCSRIESSSQASWNSLNATYSSVDWPPDDASSQVSWNSQATTFNETDLPWDQTNSQAPWNSQAATHNNIPTTLAEYCKDRSLEEDQEEKAQRDAEDVNRQNNEKLSCWRCSNQKIRCHNPGGRYPCCEECEGKDLRRARVLCNRVFIPDATDLVLPIFLQGMNSQDAVERTFVSSINAVTSNFIRVRLSNGIGFNFFMDAYEFEPKSGSVLRQLQFSETAENACKLEPSPHLALLLPHSMDSYSPVRQVMKQALDDSTKSDADIMRFANQCFAADSEQRWLLEIICHYITSTRSHLDSAHRHEDHLMLQQALQSLMLTYTMAHTLTMSVDGLQHLRQLSNYLRGNYDDGVFTEDSCPKIINMQLKSVFIRILRLRINQTLTAIQKRLRRHKSDDFIPVMCTLLILCMVIEEHQAALAEVMALRQIRQAMYQQGEEVLPKLYNDAAEMDSRVKFLIAQFQAIYSIKRPDKAQDLVGRIDTRLRKGNDSHYRYNKECVDYLVTWMIAQERSGYARSRLPPTIENTRQPMTDGSTLFAWNFRKRNISRLASMFLFSLCKRPPPNLKSKAKKSYSKLIAGGTKIARHAAYRLLPIVPYGLIEELQKDFPEPSKMFEKSLYDLIRGLRNHKGHEKEYIQNSIKECRVEIKGQDMDLKATALLKLVYLEMFGYDMSWSSFHALEVMSSAQYLQKRVGYLAAVQSFRPNTDVLMLATNLLKKDVTSPSTQVMTLPLGILPHVANSQLAMSLLGDLIPRLGHSKATIRKKTVLTLYRLALVYPETLRVAWPKIKERLMDEKEDPSVTGAVINVTCELGWRRPRDFLPLAPRLFELLVEGSNNWMAIKIIKLFATLTPLEPRLVRKLLPPLTSIIKTTPAMSLLYECINGIIQGGILDVANKTNEIDEIATLCVEKLRGMIATEDDPNLRYVALLAFKKIVSSYPHLADLHQDIILSCIDDADISIRTKALDLMTGMVSAENLEFIVNTLLKQLQVSRDNALLHGPDSDRPVATSIEPAADSDGEDPEESLQSTRNDSTQTVQLPDDYKISVVKTILSACSADTYAFVLDFSWYIGILVQLTRLVPYINSSPISAGRLSAREDFIAQDDDLSTAVGSELRNIAVRVQGIRQEAIRAAEMLIVTDQQTQSSSDRMTMSSSGFLGPIVWIVGEYSGMLSNSEQVLESLLNPSNLHLNHRILSMYLQASMKIYCSIVNTDTTWDKESKAMASLRTARVLHFLDLLTSHPSLEVQERAVSFAEFLRITTEAIANCKFESDETTDAPLLLTSALPSFFSGAELKPVAPDAQRKIPLPSALDFDEPINPRLNDLLQSADQETYGDFQDDDTSEDYYHKKPDSRLTVPAADALQGGSPSSSYQKDNSTEANASYSSRKVARNRDDPFYIQQGGSLSGTSTPIHEILRDSNDESLDVDSIPIMALDLEGEQQKAAQVKEKNRARLRSKRANISIEKDEDLDFDAESEQAQLQQRPATSKSGSSRKGLLGVDSSALSNFNMETSAENESAGTHEPYEEDAEMAKALKEVERLRLEMQRASERIEAAQGVPREGTLVKKKKRKKVVVAPSEVEGGPSTLDAVPVTEAMTPAEVVKKKKKRKKPKEALAKDQGEAVNR